MTTKDYINAYFDTLPATTAKRTRTQLDRHELYEQERESGRKIGEWKPEDVLGFLEKCANNKRSLRVRTLEYMYHLLGRFFDWYIENVEVIMNPCRSQNVKAEIKKLVKSEDAKKIPTVEEINDVYKAIRANHDIEHANYCECLLRLAYDGFAEVREIVNLKESDIDFAEQSVMIRGAKHYLSDRTFSLLMVIHNTESYDGYRSKYYMISYNDGYFRFPTKESYVGRTGDRDEKFYMNYLSRIFNRDVKSEFGYAVNIRDIFIRGFYERMKEHYGKERLDEMISSLNDSAANAELMRKALEYGMSVSVVTYLKRELTRCM